MELKEERWVPLLVLNELDRVSFICSFVQGSSEAIASRTTGSFSLDTKPVKALDARTRTRRLLWVEHLLMNGMNRKGSRASPVSLVIVEGLSLDKRISIGQRLG